MWLAVGRRLDVLLVYGVIGFRRTADKVKTGMRARKQMDKQSVDASTCGMFPQIAFLLGKSRTEKLAWHRQLHSIKSPGVGEGKKLDGLTLLEKSACLSLPIL